jgi:hypothetical protein
MAKVYEEGFSKYLEGAVKGLKECLEQDENGLDVELGEEAQDLIGTEVTIEGRKIKVASATDDDDSDLNEAAMAEDDDDEWDDLGGVSAVAMEKEIAAEVLGDIITHTRNQFMPYLEDIVTKLLELVNHDYEGVRKASLGTLWRTFACIFGMAEGGGMQKWQPGLPLSTEPPEELKKLGNLVMMATMSVWQDEMDRYVPFLSVHTSPCKDDPSFVNPSSLRCQSALEVKAILFLSSVYTFEMLSHFLGAFTDSLQRHRHRHQP